MTRDYKRKKLRRIVLIVIVIIIIIIVGYLIWNNFFNSGARTETWQQIELTKENLPDYLSQFKIVNDLPKEGIIALTLGEGTYTIERGNVREGLPSHPDISIVLPEAYFEIIGKVGWCAGLQTARERGELHIALQDSETSLLWKYRTLGAYKSCLA